MTAVDADGVTLSSGEVVPAATVVWCAGMRASPLTEQFPVERDRLGRLTVDDYLRVVGVSEVFAAGDVAAAKMDDEHLSVMSCQHGRPMGRYAGYNVIGDLLGEPMLALRIPWYVTVLDLGPAGAVYTEGWDRKVVATGAAAKATKTVINSQRIYPPLTGDRAALSRRRTRVAEPARHLGDEPPAVRESSVARRPATPPHLMERLALPIRPHLQVRRFKLWPNAFRHPPGRTSTTCSRCGRRVPTPGGSRQGDRWLRYGHRRRAVGD